MLIEGEKYACEACVRGHRVSNCQHSGKGSHVSDPRGIVSNRFHRQAVDAYQQERPAGFAMSSLQRLAQGSCFTCEM